MLIITQICKTMRPGRPNESDITPPYDMALPEDEYLMRKSIEVYVRNPTNIIITRPGIKPMVLIVAGRPIMPAPTMLVERLNIALGTDAAL